jgi:subtilisin family serine protease
MLVRSSRAGFARAARAQGALTGVARNRVIGKATPGRRAKPDVEQEGRAGADGRGGVTIRADAAPGDLAEPLSDWQWDMRVIGATPTGSYATQQGSEDVIVAVIDTGIDGSHPDIAPNFNKTLSHNWTTDKPDIDGACVSDPDTPARTRTTSMRTATGPTWRERSPRRSTTSAWPASPRR